MELNSSTVVTYEYDSASRLVQRVEGGTTTNYTWDGWDLIKEVKSGTVNETTNYLVPFGELLALERGGDFFYLHGDGLSSTQLVTDENGDQVGRFIYGAWGEELYANESVPGLFDNRFVGGLGCRKDAVTGLIYMRHRWYDPALQRFVSRDILYAANRYAYAAGNPTNYLDIDGKKVTISQELVNYCLSLGFPDMGVAFQRAIDIAIGKVSQHCGCSSWPQDINYLDALQGNWDVNFVMAKDPDLWVPWQTLGSGKVRGTSSGCISKLTSLQLNLLADQILHELTHAGIYRNFEQLKPAVRALYEGPYDPALVGPPGTIEGDDPGSHPQRYFEQGIYKCQGK